MRIKTISKDTFTLTLTVVCLAVALIFAGISVQTRSTQRAISAIRAVGGTVDFAGHDPHSGLPRTRFCPGWLMRIVGWDFLETVTFVEFDGQHPSELTDDLGKHLKRLKDIHVLHFAPHPGTSELQQGKVQRAISPGQITDACLEQISGLTNVSCATAFQAVIPMPRGHHKRERRTSPSAFRLQLRYDACPTTLIKPAA